ncbi:MAG: ATP-binding cassette domain-containing protein, partial [Pseudomonadota bacterium]
MTAPAIRLTGITKRFGPVLANDAVDLEVAPGTIHGIIGENGAGKST